MHKNLYQSRLHRHLVKQGNISDVCSVYGYIEIYAQAETVHEFL